MLSDLERKLLRILYNFSLKQRRMPNNTELVRLTGRSQAEIMKGLRGLVEQSYIFWPDNPDLSTIVILEAWDRDAPLETSKSNGSSYLDYITRY
ncbi:hypothetical protein [Paenibacillus segetis]|uniref:MarR family transcriptional regulator n=1 Tax=Paenibacillus segetis TaxID=1325360 RepID=A0ABQ1YAK9_9BACL|nr:hypothetical protein [Paenibacillus segetis]GGH17493.1 hypothetical protein GCM10008013_12870 [Paenibacillus segetis]